MRLPDLTKHPHIAAHAVELRALTRVRNREKARRRRKRDPMYSVLNAQRSRVRMALKANRKHDTTRGLIGCSIAELKTHLEKQFTLGMTWDNYGSWEVDHIRPCASFDLREPEEQWRCFHFTNLQPLWKLDNIRKGATYSQQ